MTGPPKRPKYPVAITPEEDEPGQEPPGPQIGYLHVSIAREQAMRYVLAVLFAALPLGDARAEEGGEERS